MVYCEEQLVKELVSRLCPSVSRWLAICWPSVGQLSADCSSEGGMIGAFFQASHLHEVYGDHVEATIV